MKKRISLLLALVMVLSCMGIGASATEAPILIMGALASEYDITIKVHYYREDAAYGDWEVHMWNGVETLDATRAFTLEDVEYEGTVYGATATYYADAADSWVGFIIKKPDWTKDPDGDRKIDVSDVLSGTVHVYAKTGSALEDFIVDKSEAQVGAKIVSAIYDSIEDTLTVTTAAPVEGTLKEVFTLEGPDGQMKIKGVSVEEGTNEYVLDYEGTINSEDVFTVYHKGTPCVVTVPNIYSTEYFENLYTYEGDDLGATWSAEGASFRLWAPNATAVSVNLYQSGTEGTDDLIASYEMTADVNGTWVGSVEGDLNGVYYTYSVTRRGQTVEAVDPYARTTGVNGNRAMILNLDSTDPEGWEMCTWTTKENGTVPYSKMMTIQPNDTKVNTEAGTSAMILTAAAADAELKPLAEETADEMTEEEAGSMLNSIKAFFEDLFG